MDNQKKENYESMSELAKTKRRHKLIGRELVNYSFDVDELKLVPLGDVHYGSPTCNWDKFVKTVQYIKDSGSYTILMGDLMEAASSHSVGSGWVEQTTTPQDQLDDLYEILEPIKDRILVLLDGNHEDRIWKHSGIQVSRILAQRLGVPYGGYSCFVKLKVGKSNYIIHAQHGSSGARFAHTKLTAVMRVATYADADVYLYGHTHGLTAQSTLYRNVSLRNKMVYTRKRYFCLTGSFLEYDGSYAQRKDMQPVKTGVVKLKFFGKRWDIHESS